MLEGRFQLRGITVLLAGLALTGACCNAGGPPAGRGPGGAPAAATTAPAEGADDLAAVLHHAVTGSGWIVIDNLQERAGSLRAHLKRLEACGPTATPAEFPARGDRLAYWFNARLACSLELAIRAGCPAELTPSQLAGTFRLDGRTMGLADIDAALAAEGDWRVPVAAPGVTMDRAAPPRRPFAPAEVEAALQDRVERFVYDKGRFEIDLDARQVRVPPVLWSARDALARRYAGAYGKAAPSVWAAMEDALGGPARRRLQDAVGYNVVPATPTGRTCLRHWYDLLP